MSLFGNDTDKINKKSNEATGTVLYPIIKCHLSPKDGKIHVVMVNSFSKWLNQRSLCEENYTGQIDGILSRMQDDGYEILDVKFNSIQNQDITGQMEGFYTLITYR